MFWTRYFIDPNAFISVFLELNFNQLPFYKGILSESREERNPQIWLYVLKQSTLLASSALGFFACQYVRHKKKKVFYKLERETII